MPTIMAARAPIPPTTPPTIAPIGVELFFLFLFKSPPLVSSKPGFEPSIDVTGLDAIFEAEVKDTVTGLSVVDFAPVAVADPIKCLSASVLCDIAERSTHQVRALSCR
jgi:hypothetical protein